MYLTSTQVEFLLQNPYYTQEMTQSAIEYRLFRGHLNATVHTLRFNLIDVFTENMMIDRLYTYLLSVYNLNTRVLATIDYDLLLENSGLDVSSFYVWRANSNAVNNYRDDIFLTFTYNNLYAFAKQALNINLPNLNMYFRSSNVIVVRPIAIVFSFINI
jgi:hypothetical protein